MRFVRLQQHGDNRQISLLSRGLARQLEDGGTYLIADSSVDDFLPAEQLNNSVESMLNRCT
jgi:hypothetical protein